MAKDKFGEGLDEENESNDFGSDDDFGLPDLEFDDLEELDMTGGDSDDSSESDSDSTLDMESMGMPDNFSDFQGSSLMDGDLDPPGSALDQGIDEVEDVLDSAQLISDRLGDDSGSEILDLGESSGVNYDDLLGESSKKGNSSSDSLFSADYDDQDDLLAGIDSPDDLAALGMADEDEDDTSSLFGMDDNNDLSDDDSIFSTDKINTESDDFDDFKPSENASLPPTYKAYSYEESSGGINKWIIGGILVIAILACGLWKMSTMSNDDDKNVAKVVVKKEPPVVKEEKQDSVEVVVPKKEQKPKPKTISANSATPGEIVEVTSNTSRAYVIIGSFVDQDMAMDFAQKLSSAGRGVKVLHPFGTQKRFRVSIADYNTYGDASSELEKYKDEFGADIWALKY